MFVCVVGVAGCWKLEVSGPDVKDVNLIQPPPPPPAPFPLVIILSIMSSWKGEGVTPYKHTHTHSQRSRYTFFYINTHMYEFVKSLNAKV